MHAMVVAYQRRTLRLLCRSPSLNIVILSNQDIASNFALNLLLPALSKTHSVTLWLSHNVGKSDTKPPALKQLAFFEQRLFNDFLSPLLEQKSSTSFLTFQQLGHYLQTPPKEVNNINAPLAIAELDALNLDLIISIRYGCILKEPVMGLSKHGILNLHSGILPNYRGVMATFWSMYQRAPEIGTTLHYIEDGSIDTGRVITISKQSVDYGRSYLSNVLNLYPQGVQDILDAVNHIELSSEVLTTPQRGQDQYFTFPTQQQLDEFEQSGMQLTNESELRDFLAEYYF